MSSLNVPSFVPTVVVPKQQKPWQQALMQVLAGAATGAAQQGVSNAMTRDYSADPATGFDKLISGPKQNAAMELDTRRQAAEDNRLKAQIAGQIGLQELANSPGAKDMMAVEEADKGRAATADLAKSNRELSASMHNSGIAATKENIIAELASRMGITDKEIAARSALADKENTNRNAMLQAEQTFNKPYREAQIGNLGASTGHVQAQTEAQKTMNAIQRRMLPPDTTRQDATATRLQDTKKYPTAETVTGDTDARAKILSLLSMLSPVTAPFSTVAPMIPKGASPAQPGTTPPVIMTPEEQVDWYLRLSQP